MSKKTGFADVLRATKAARVAADKLLSETEYDPEAQANAAMREVLDLLLKAEGLAAQAAYWRDEESGK